MFVSTAAQTEAIVNKQSTYEEEACSSCKKALIADFIFKPNTSSDIFPQLLFVVFVSL